MTSTLYNLDRLVGWDVLDPAFSRSALAGFAPKEWLPRIMEQHLVVARNNFYKNLAELYDLHYFSELDIPLNPKDTLAYRIPTEILIEAQLYPYLVDDKLYVATTTPFIVKESLQNVLSFTGRAGYELVMTTPYQLKEALKRLYYIEFSVVAESNLKYSKKNLSASPPRILQLAKVIVMLGLVVVISGFILPTQFLLGLFFFINAFYIYLNALRFTTFIKSLLNSKKVSVDITSEAIAELEDKSLPRYSILVPLRFEANIVERLVKRMEEIDYPKSKLEVMFLVGVDDAATIEALLEAGIDTDSQSITAYSYYMTMVKVPKVQVDTKPLVCNYGLRFATGDYTVIYDAEDKPQLDQLKKAVIGYQVSSLDTVCLQGKLNFYNDRKNLLTRFFSLEYGMWYNFFLPGLQSIGSPVPLGGTSNHFLTKALRQAGEWDPYNVTEDADLGMRIYRNNYRTRILNSYTYEEATTTIKPWLIQRARWEKGFLATLIVHLRHPVSLYKELGFKKFIYGVTVFFGNFYMPFINPLLWIITILWLLGIFTLGPLPAYIWIPAVFNLIIGNLIHMTMHFMAAIKLKRYDLAPLAIIIPFYWALISIATYMASWEIFFRPYQWNKTAHGKD